MPLPASPGGGLSRPLSAIVAALAAAILIGAALIAFDLYSEKLAEAEQDNRRLAIVLAAQTERLLQAVSLVLRDLARDAGLNNAATPEQFHTIMATRAWHDEFVSRLSGLPQVAWLSAIDAEGGLANISLSWPPPSFQVADRPYFAVMRRDGAPELGISEPTVSRANDTRIVLLMRRISAPDGSFLGMLTGTVQLAYFDAFYDAIGLPPGMRVSLVRSDGMFLASFPRDTELVGSTIIMASPDWHHAMAAGGGEYWVRGVLDGSARLISVSPVSGFPLAVDVGITRTAMLAPLWGKFAAIGLVAAGSVGGLAVLLRLLLIQFRRLGSAKEAAENAGRAKAQFLATMSHEIRTPLNVILGFANSLRRDIDDCGHADKLAKIDWAANHLLAIINDTLDMSKIEAGQMPIDAHDFSLRTLLANVMSQISSQAEAKGLAVRLDIATDIPDRLHGDATRISQCLINYGSNAVKFTPSGAVTVRAGLDCRIGSGLTLRFEVEDTGVGIVPEVLPRLFTPFEQADRSTTRKFGGTGLGLALTKRFAEMMGGHAGGASTPGTGSCFWFTVLVHAGDGQSESQAPLKKTSVILAREFSGTRLLVAEDIALNREIIHDLLKQAGLTVDMAENGEVAVAKAGVAIYDLILMDMQMPVMDGLAATRAIRKLPGYGKTPIISLTANAFGEDRERCLAAGMSDFLIKPVRAEVLHATLLRWLRSQATVPPRTGVAASSGAVQPNIPPSPVTGHRPVSTAPGPFAVAELLDNVDANRSLAIRLVGTFRDSFGDAAAELRRLIDLKRLERAEHLVHALRGVAGQMAANSLRTAAGELESALRNLPTMLLNVSATLDDSMAAVGPLVETLQANPQTGQADIPKMEATTMATERQSVSQDGGGSQTLTELQRTLRGYVSRA